MKLVKQAVPAVRRKLISGQSTRLSMFNCRLPCAACVRFARVAVLDALLDPLTEQFGVECGARFLHGCSPALIQRKLTETRLFIDSKFMRWHKLNGE